MHTITHVFQVDGMHCASCSLLIDDALDDLPGVRDTHTTIKTGRSTVQLDPNRTSPDDVVKAIEDLGYRATKLS